MEIFFFGFLPLSMNVEPFYFFSANIRITRLRGLRRIWMRTANPAVSSVWVTTLRTNTEEGSVCDGKARLASRIFNHRATSIKLVVNSLEVYNPQYKQNEIFVLGTASQGILLGGHQRKYTKEEK